MRINVLTPWYPDKSLGRTYNGIFVERQVEALENIGFRVSVEVPRLYRHPERIVPDDIKDCLSKLAFQDPSKVFRRQNNSVSIPTLVPLRATMAEKAESISEALALKRSTERFHADINHVHVALPIAPSILEISETPLVITEHSSHVRHECQIPEVAEMYKASISSSKAFICVSRFLQQEISDILGLEIDSSWKVVPNIVDFSEFHYRHRREYLCKSWVYVGALLESKGVVNLLKTFKHFKSNHDNGARLTLVGSGPLEKWIKRFCLKNKINDSVTIKEPVSQKSLAAVFSTMDLMVHLSPYETFGIVSLEAIASGLPVVSIKNGGSENTWEDLSDISGLVLDPSSTPKAISKAIQEWRSGGIKVDLKDASEILRKRFSSEVIANHLKEIYEEVLS
tara:strand:- start:89 stop:1276 length:1188 start_codon:yes stop_codon:yes gene_type:complete